MRLPSFFTASERSAIQQVPATEVKMFKTQFQFSYFSIMLVSWVKARSLVDIILSPSCLLLSVCINNQPFP